MLWWRKVPYSIVCFWRIALPLLLWQEPFWVMLGAVLLDCDWQLFLLAFTEEREKNYQKLDKALDFYWYSIAFVFSLQSRFWLLFLIFFVIRLAGEILFYLKNERKIFFYFPNLFENFFIFYIFTLKFPSLASWLEGPLFWVTLSVLAGLKLVQEYLAHIALFDLPTWVKGRFV